jgi:hypothetical protein
VLLSKCESTLPFFPVVDALAMIMVVPRGLISVDGSGELVPGMKIYWELGRSRVTSGLIGSIVVVPSIECVVGDLGI